MDNAMIINIDEEINKNNSEKIISNNLFI